MTNTNTILIVILIIIVLVGGFFWYSHSATPAAPAQQTSGIQVGAGTSAPAPQQ